MPCCSFHEIEAAERRKYLDIEQEDNPGPRGDELVGTTVS